jgi:5-methylcytosine-specific restriction endonuclease McrA
VKVALTPAAHRLLVRTLADGASWADAPHLEDEHLDGHARDCRELLRLVARRAAPKKALPGVSRAEKRAAKQATQRAEMARLREAVMARAHGRCEVCYQREAPANPLHLHHRKGGSGRRRQEQSPENCIAVCLVCHRREHGERIAEAR